MTRRPPTTEIRIVLRTILSAGVLAVLVLACAGTAAGATWVVDDDGGAGVDFTTIQAAVDAASAGDTIEVRGGMYVENVDVNKELTLIGEGADVVTVQAVDASDHVFDVTVDYVNISGFTVMGATSSYKAGIYLYYHAEHCNISWNNVSNSQFGIYLHYSNNNIITNNTANLNNYHGICLASSSNNIITNNTANLNNNYGIYLSSSSGNNTLWNNQMAGNKYNFGVSGESEELSDNDIRSSNTVDGKPIYYWVDYQNMDVPLDAGYVALVNCYNISVEGLKLKNNGQGILLVNTTNSQITNNSVNNCSVGTYFYHSSYNSLSGNNITNNHLGIYIRASSNINTISGNTIVNNDECGVMLYSSNNSLSGNTIADNGETGVQVSDGSFNIISENTITKNRWGGIIIYGSNNTISGNTITKNRDGANGCGVYLRGAGSFNNTICRNDITENKWGIYLYPLSNNNTIFGNNLIKNNNGGIFLWKSSNNSFFGNNITGSYYGIALSLSNNNIVLRNNIKNNRYGVYFGYYAHPSSYNTVSENNITSNSYGIYFRNSSNNEIFHNNLIDNTNYNAYDDSGTNQWDSGAEGNHYGDDYTGTDSDGDGIGDTPYPIPGGSSEDRYPLMAPYIPHTGPSDRSLVQVEGEPEVYWLQNGRLYWVTDWNVINDMSGVPGWDSVNTLPASEFDPATYPQGPRFVTTGAGSDGLLIRQIGDYKVYRIENGRKRHITYPDVMDLKGYSFDDVIEVSSEISDMFPLGDPIGIEVDLYFNKKTDSGDISHESQFTTGETVKSITETTVAEDYTVETYVRMIKPDGTGKFAYHENSNFQPTDPLQFSDIKRSLYPGTWSAQTKTWNWDEYTFDGTKMEGVYIWEFWYEDVASGKVLGKDVQGYEFTNTPPSPDDTTPPLVRIISPIDGGTVYDSYVLVSGIAFDSSGIETLTVNDQDVLSIPVYGVLAFGSLVNLKDGLNEITILARDDSENHNEIIGKITVDYYPFNVKITSPKNGDIFKLEESILFKGEVNGGTPPFECDWIINDEVKNSGTSDSGSIEYLSEGLTLDEYKVKLRVTDFKGYVFETNEVQFFVKPPKPDLIVADILFSNDYPAEGEPITVTARIKNIGPVDVQGDMSVYFWQVSYYDKPDGQGNRAIIESKSGPGLASGQEVETEITWNAASVFTTQDGIFEVQIDPESKIDEIDKNNNKRFGKVTITSHTKFLPERDAYHFENFEPSNSQKIEMVANAKAWFDLTTNPFGLGIDISSLIGGPLCYGMSATNILYFEERLPKPVDKKVFDMSKTDNDVTPNILRYQAMQFPDILFNLVKGLSPDYLVNVEKEFNNIEDSIKNGEYVVSHIRFYYADGSTMGSHAVVPIGTYSTDKIKNVIVYDPNHPGMSRVIQFDFEKNKIKYEDLDGRYPIHASYLTTQKPLVSISDGKTVLDLIYKSLFDIKSKLFMFKCPIDVLITDHHGRIIDNKGNNEIPDAKVKIIGDSKMFLLPADLDYTIRIDAYDSGDFTFTQINPLTNEYASVISFVDIPITESTKAISEVSSTNPEYMMEIDYNGDGATDEIKIPDIIDIIGVNFYNITFLPPITTTDHFNLKEGSTLPIKFTARNSSTNDFIFDDTVNVTITNSTGHLIAFFTNGTGTDSVRINSTEEQYIVNFHTKDYDLNVGETYTIHVTFGEPDTLRGYAITHFTLVDLNQ